LNPVLETLCDLDWTGRLDERMQTTSRYILLANRTLLLLHLLLPGQKLPDLWEKSLWPSPLLRMHYQLNSILAPGLGQSCPLATINGSKKKTSCEAINIGSGVSVIWWWPQEVTPPARLASLIKP
jgi:hypothetical protein